MSWLAALLAFAAAAGPPAAAASRPAAATTTAPPAASAAGTTSTPPPGAAAVPSAAPAAASSSTPSAPPTTTAPAALVPLPTPLAAPVVDRTPPVHEIPPEPPRDPNDAPFMRAPNNQIQPVKLRTTPDLRRGYSSARRFAFTVAPLFASFRLPFIGRGDGRTHGVGIGGEVDVQLMKWLWIRAQGSYSAHPVQDQRFADDMGKTVITAAAGTIKAAGFGAGPVIALDLGRFLPLIEGGIGGLRVVTPEGVIAGQLGQQCQDSGACDVGLRCGGDNRCHQSMIPELYFGGAIDVLVRRHFSFGAQFRYYALISAPGKFPVFLVGGLRVAVRF